MIQARRVSQISALVMLAAATTGCVVLPWGGHHRHGRGGHHHLTEQTGVSVPVATLQVQSRPVATSNGPTQGPGPVRR